MSLTLLTDLAVTPSTALLYYNYLDSESSLQLQVKGALVDGFTVGLAGKARGTQYESSGLSVSSFAPTVKGYVSQTSTANNVDVKNGVAFIATNKGLSVVGVSDPATPVLISELDSGNPSVDVKYFADYVYLADKNGTKIFSVVNLDASKAQ